MPLVCVRARYVGSIWWTDLHGWRCRSPCEWRGVTLERAVEHAYVEHGAIVVPCYAGVFHLHSVTPRERPKVVDRG